MHGWPDCFLPVIHSCLNHWFRSFNPKVYKMKGKCTKGQTAIATQMQLTRLAYNRCAARTVFPAITKGPTDITNEDCTAIREHVLLALLRHAVGQHDKCHACHPNLAEPCPVGRDPWCPACIHEEMQNRGDAKHDESIEAAVQAAEAATEAPPGWEVCHHAAASGNDSDFLKN